MQTVLTVEVDPMLDYAEFIDRLERRERRVVVAGVEMPGIRGIPAEVDCTDEFLEAIESSCTAGRFVPDWA